MNVIQKRLKLIKTSRTSQSSIRYFSSEFKKYFGFEEKLEQRKFRNDDNMEFSIKKMDKVGLVFTSCCNI